MKFTIALATSGLLFGGSAAIAAGSTGGGDQPYETFQFEAAQGQPDVFNGSTLYITNLGSGGQDGVGVVMVDTDLGTTPITDSFDTSGITSFDSTGWSGEFSFGTGSYEFTLNGSPDSIDRTPIEPTGLDPFSGGVWVAINPSPAPDASSTFPLLLGVLGALAGVYHCNRLRIPALVSIRR